MTVWVFCAVAVFSSLLINLLLLSLAGVLNQMLWAIELHFDFFWFSAIYRYLKHDFMRNADCNPILDDLKPLIGYLFFAHLATTAVLRFGFHVNLIFAYLGIFFLVTAIPFKLALFIYPR